MNLKKSFAVSVAIIALPALVVAGCIGPGKSKAARQEPAIAGVECAPLEQVAFHIHPILNLYKNGKPVTVPAGIGIVDSDGDMLTTTVPTSAGVSIKCLYWIHTHSIDNIIHIESPKQVDYTLGQFLAIWGKKTSATSVAGMSVGSNQGVRVTVDDKPYTGSVDDIVLKDGEKIVIQVGPPYFEPTPTPTPNPPTPAPTTATPTTTPAGTATPKP